MASTGLLAGVNPYKGGNVAIDFTSKPLSRKFNPSKVKNGKVILVGTEVSIIDYRLENNLSDDHKIEYLKNKIKLFKGFKDELKSFDFYYRPYLNKKPYAVDDELFALNYLPQDRLILRNFIKEAKKCSLLIIDHPGTTLAMSLANFIPSLLIWTYSTSNHISSKVSLYNLIHLSPAPESSQVFSKPV